MKIDQFVPTAGLTLDLCLKALSLRATAKHSGFLCAVT